jgi:hypothetical protein
MNLAFGLLLWPVGMFLQAVCGVLHQAKTPTIALYQKTARLALLTSVVVFSTIPMLLILKSAIRLPLALGGILLLAFVVLGKLCDDQNDGKDDAAAGRGLGDGGQPHQRGNIS